MHKIRLIILSIFLAAPGILQSTNPSHTASDSGFSFNSSIRSVRIPARISHNLVVIQMRINDSPPLNFILDTGVNTTILTEPLIAHIFNFMTEESVFILGLGNEGIIEAGMARNLTFKLNGITGSNMNLIVLPEGVLTFSELFGYQIHGIIGYDFFKNFPVMVNYRRSFVRVFRNPSYRVGRRSRVIPLEIENNKPYIYVDIQGKDNLKRIDSLRLLVDLGATNSLYLNRQYIDLAPETIPSYLGKGISGDLKGDKGRIEYMSIGDIKLDKPLAAFPQEEFLNIVNLNYHWEGIMGGGILKRFRSIIDYPSEQIVLRPNVDFRAPFRINPSGLEIVSHGANFRQYIINYVREGSPADEQKIMAGDRILKINGGLASSYTMDDVLNILYQRSGTKVQLEIQRDQQILRRTILLREDI